MRENIKPGERVKLIGIPPDVNNDDELQTLALFQKCLGHSFVIADVEVVAGLSNRLAKLNVGRILGESSGLHTIWVEEKYLQSEISD